MAEIDGDARGSHASKRRTDLERISFGFIGSIVDDAFCFTFFFPLQTRALRL